MPLYEYRCSKCENIISIQRLISERNELPICCNEDVSGQSCGTLMDIQISSSTFHLKGSGWFKDGYQKK